MRHIRPSHLDEWLAIHEGRLKNTSYHRYAGCLKQMFDIAVNDRIVAVSPLRTSGRSVVNGSPITQTTAQTSWSFLASLDWDRPKRLHWSGATSTGTTALFDVPIYPELRPLLERLKAKAGRPLSNRRVLAIKDAKKALAAACERLGYPKFSQRSMRQFLIGRLWKAGVDRKLIAKWQGHRDGGKLIIDTYTEVFGDDDFAYEQQQLAKLTCAASRSLLPVLKTAVFRLR